MNEYFAKVTMRRLLGLLLISSCGFTPAFAKGRWQIKAPNAEKMALEYKSLLAQVEKQTSGLEVQISSPNSDQGRIIRLDQVRPRMSVVIRNTSDKTINLFYEENSWGFYNLHLEVLGLNGRALHKPLIISRGSQSWLGNTPSTEQIAPGEAVVRDVWLYLPAAIKYPNKAPSIVELNESLNPSGDRYWSFPFPPKFETSVVVMKVVFEVNSDETSKKVGAWTGRVSSSPFEYKVRWGLQRP